MTAPLYVRMADAPTDPALLTRLREAAKRGPTPHESYEQKVSYIMAEVGVTREQVVAVIGPEPGRTT